MRRGLRVPTRDIRGQGAVFKVLITFMVMCSQEVHKCQHATAMGILFEGQKGLRARAGEMERSPFVEQNHRECCAYQFSLKLLSR